MYLSLPLCRILTTSELSAVIVHELAHFKGEDTAFSLNFYPIYRGTVAAIDGVAQTAGKITALGSHIPIRGVGMLAVVGALTLCPSIFMLRFFLECFASAESAISRERELTADSLAAASMGPISIASALFKIHAFAGLWPCLSSILRDALLAGYVEINGETQSAQRLFANLCDTFAFMAKTRIEEGTSLDGLDATTIPHPTDSHPPLNVRLAALGKSLSDLRADALNVTPDVRSSTVIDNYQAIECDLSQVERAILGPRQPSLEQPGLAA